MFDKSDLDAFARLYFSPGTTQNRLYVALAPCVERFTQLAPDEQADSRRQLDDYVRLYAFLSQVLTFADADLEKLYVLARLLRRRLPSEREALPREIQRNIDMESYRIRQSFRGRIGLERATTEVQPAGPKGTPAGLDPELEPLSLIIRELNERFGTDFTEEDPGVHPAARGEARRRRSVGGERPGQHAGERSPDVRSRRDRPSSGDGEHELQLLQAGDRHQDFARFFLD